MLYRSISKLVLFSIFFLLFACSPTQASQLSPSSLITMTPDRIALAVSGTQTALAETTAIVATLTALAPVAIPGTPIPQTAVPSQSPTVVGLVPNPTLFIQTVTPLPTLFVLPTMEITIRTVTPIPAKAPQQGAPTPYASLINQHTQKCLTALGNSIVQATCVQSPNQLWLIQSGEGPFKMTSKNGICLSFADVDVVASTCNGSTPWKLRRWGDYSTIENIRKAAGKSPHGGPSHPHPAALEYGIYFQIMDGGNCVDVDGWNHNENGRIIYWPCNGTIGDNANQLWAFVQK